MNASELSNQALARLLYEKKTNHNFILNRNKSRDSRSRNVTDPVMSKGNAAGQSTSSFFNTKKNF